ncbi:MAG: cyanoexosortase A system-associated protein, partial [Cyanobacteria bacterium J06555_13]
MNIPWNRFRLFLLISVFGAALLVLGKVSFLEKSSDFTSKEVRLPESVPLQGWAGRSSTALNDQDSTKPDYLVGREYSYAQNSLILSIQVRYIKPTNGNVKGFIKKYLPSTPLDEEEWEVHTLKGVGSFLLATDRDEIKLSSCLNPYGGSTVSIEEYKRNRNFQDIRYRFIP